MYLLASKIRFLEFRLVLEFSLVLVLVLVR